MSQPFDFNKALKATGRGKFNWQNGILMPLIKPLAEAALDTLEAK